MYVFPKLRKRENNFPCDDRIASVRGFLDYVSAYISILEVTSVLRLIERESENESLYIHRLHFVRISRSSLFSDLFVYFRRLIK